jgi:hypothetical protein
MVDYEIRTAADDFYCRSIDLATVLKISDNEISRLVRSAVMTRVADPKNGKAFLYPFFACVTAYTEFHRGKREAIQQEFLKAKAGRETAQRRRVEMENRQRAGELVDKGELLRQLTPIVDSYRESMLARTDRLVRELSRSKGHKSRVAKLKAADLDALHVLHDLLKPGGDENGA